MWVSEKVNEPVKCNYYLLVLAHVQKISHYERFYKIAEHVGSVMLNFFLYSWQKCLSKLLRMLLCP